MTIKNLQKWVEEDWKSRSSHKPSPELQLLYVIEEFGEVAEAIRKSKGSKKRKNVDLDLGSEFSDLMISIITLANEYNVDLEKEIESFKARLASRQKDGH